MPLYQYRNEKTGEIEEHVRPVSERDDMPEHLTRFQVPCSIAVVGLGAGDPSYAHNAIPKTLRTLEDKYSREEIEKQTGFTKEQLKHHWMERPTAKEEIA